ncbi:hypothetical protein [Deefgea piscis]|uniref:hypothetical protein n=1 Tax=Deefgea piscis TaxID=2739061 RepID=UPI001C7E1EC3|nr:hypothetical protein [Deefgea piscis]QZA80854.1 hypothetical protein K4H25_15390 [Deefgea piscis]
MDKDIHPLIHKLEQHGAALQDLSDLLSSAGGIDPNAKRTVHLLDIIARDHRNTVTELSKVLPINETL